MNKDSYKQALDDATAELDVLIEKRREIEERITKLRGTILGLSRLFNDISQDDLSEMLHEPGLTDAIRHVLQTSKKEFTPTEVRDALWLNGYNLSDQSNMMASIHSVLRRLVASKEAASRVKGEKMVYKWRGEDPLTNPKARNKSFREILDKKRASQRKK